MIHPVRSTRILGTLLAAILLVGGSSLLAQERLHAASNSDVQVQVSKTINIKQAGSEELQTLRGVGPAIAERIIKYRNERGRFERLEDLNNVPGIGKAKLEKLKEQISI